MRIANEMFHIFKVFCRAVASLMEMGFEEEMAKKALTATSGDVERALEILVSGGAG